MADLPDYDAGLLNDWGGGNVEWWQDYIRAEIGRANEHWREACADLIPRADAEKAVAEAIRRAADEADKHYANGDMGNPGHWIRDLALAPADALAEVQRLREAVEALVVVLDRNDKKGPIPDVEMMFCWLAAQGVRAAFQKIAQKGEAT